MSGEVRGILRSVTSQKTHFNSTSRTKRSLAKNAQSQVDCSHALTECAPKFGGYHNIELKVPDSITIEHLQSQLMNLGKDDALFFSHPEP